MTAVKDKLRKLLVEANFLSLVANLTIAVFGFAVFALLARSYSVSIFGQWVLYVSSATFLEMFRFGITNTAIIRYLSGVTQEERLRYIGSNGLIGLVATIAIALLLWVLNILFPVAIRNSGYELFFTWYPVMAFINLPYNTALVIMQADQKFGKLLLIKAINSIGFFIIVLLNYLFFHLGIIQLVWAQLAVNLITSVICMMNRWDGLRHIRKASATTNRTLLDFGKYTTFTLIGTNLLRSADTLIISLSPMGTAAVALYSVPLKLTELQQIPLRSFVATAFPKMSKASVQGRVHEVKKIFYQYAGALSYLFIFVSLITFVFADIFVLVLGGRQYLAVDPVLGVSTVTLVRILSIYGLLLPIDRMTGVGLDSINRPSRNFVKVMYMVLANVIGDLLAVFVFHSLELVAVGSILFTVLGVWIGYHFFNKELKVSFRNIFTTGNDFYREMYQKLRQAG